MNTKLSNHNFITKVLIFFLKVNIFLIFLFARTYTGLNIFGFRVGEIFIGVSILILLIYSFKYPIFNKSYLFNSKELNFTLVLLIVSFILFNIIIRQNFLDTFIYQTSVFIWSFGALFLGFYMTKVVNFKIYKHDKYLSLIGLFIIYIYSTKGISENRQNYILNFVDKFEYPKGSDLLLAFIFVFYFILKISNFSSSSVNILILFAALYIPLFLVKSRSGFISLMFFLIILFFYLKRSDFKLGKSFIFTCLFSILVFLVSTTWVVSRDIVIDEDIDNEIKYAITSRYQTINDNVYEKEVLKLKLFYFENGRIFSSDGNLNWRFQIWQDVLRDMIKEKNIIYGYGFNEIIPAMNSNQRVGQDSQNINVHNYIIHIISRGGLFHLALVLVFYKNLFQIFKYKGLSVDYKLIIVPLIFNSFFDPSMENAHYPLVLFFMIGLALNNSIIFNEDNKVLN